MTDSSASGSSADRRRVERQEREREEIQLHHTDASEPASNAEQVLSPKPPVGEHRGEEEPDESDPAAAERFAREADRSSVGRGT
jgi:hypothetical protein